MPPSVNPFFLKQKQTNKLLIEKKRVNTYSFWLHTFPLLLLHHTRPAFKINQKQINHLKYQIQR